MQNNDEEICNSKWSCLLMWDKTLTGRLAVCSSADSSWGRLRPLTRLLEYSGHGIPWFAGVLAALLASHQIDLQQRLLNFFCALLLDVLVISLIKAFVQRQRPVHNGTDQVVWSVDKFSFPSGHASRATLVASFVLVQFDVCWVGMATVLWAAIVCLSRVMLGRHHVSDVFCGAVIGVCEYLLMDWSNAWLTADTCAHLILPIQEELHL